MLIEKKEGVAPNIGAGNPIPPNGLPKALGDEDPCAANIPVPPSDAPNEKEVVVVEAAVVAVVAAVVVVPPNENIGVFATPTLLNGPFSVPGDLAVEPEISRELFVVDVDED